MSAFVASYNRFPIGKYNYSFFFVSSDSPLPDKRMREAGWEIGDQFENRGIFVQPSNRLNAITTAEEVHRKEWPTMVYARMMDEAESFVVIIDVAFEIFDPTQNSWMIVWAGVLDDVSALLGVVKWMAYLTRMQQDLFAYYGNQYAKRRYGESITEIENGLIVDAEEFIKNQGDYFVLETHLDSPIDFQGKKKAISIEAQNKLRVLLNDYFNLDDLKELCFELGIDWEQLQRDVKSNLVLDLIYYLERRGRIDELLELGEKKRPDVDWAL